MVASTDVLLSVGLPLIGPFCKLREDTFLNTVDEDARGCEAIGNWILTPSRYLFNGKKITHLNLLTKKCELQNEFHHKEPIELKIVKTAVAIVFLLPSILFGVSLKGLAFLSRNTRIRHAIIDKTVKIVDDAPGIIAKNKLKYSRVGINTESQGVFLNPNPTKKPELGGKNLPHSIQKTLRLHEINCAHLRQIIKILNHAEVLWWADFGTCLGVYRHHGIIPWDHDIDIAILAPDHDVVKYLLKSQLPKDKFEVWDFSPNMRPNSLLKIRINETNMLLDVYHYTIEDDDSEKTSPTSLAEGSPHTKKITYEFAYANEWWIPQETKKREPTHSYSPDIIFPLKKAQFDGIEVFVPNQIEDYLLAKYAGSDESKGKTKEERLKELAPCRTWDTVKKCYVPVPGHPYFKQSKFNS